MKVPKTCYECGKPRNPKIKTIGYHDEDDLDQMGEPRVHRASFCSQECRIEFIKSLDTEMTDDELLAEIPQYSKQ